jgi:uncharacterized membrane protein
MKSIWKNFHPYAIYFLLYSVLGWGYEVFLEVVVYQWGYSDRGVLFGPWCPVYGVRALVFVLCFRPLIKNPNLNKWFKTILLFFGCMLAATAIELAASYLLETIAGSWPWQTYTHYKLNFQGRIALSPSIRFGLGGLLFLYGLQPFFEWLTGKLSERTREYLAGGIIVILLLDCAATVILRVL